MAGLADIVRAHKVKAFDKADTIVRGTIKTFGGRLVNEWTPLGDPLLWKSAPPADYRPGNLQSSWFYSVNSPSNAHTDAVNDRKVHFLEDMPSSALGVRHFLSNSAPHAGAIEGGHSSQAPVGILWHAQEFPQMVRTFTATAT